MMRRLLLVTCVLAALARAQQDPDDLLRRFREKLIEAVARLPRYTCTETIDRAEFEPDAKHTPPACDELVSQVAGGRWKPRPTTSDRLRLDVANTEGKEMYSWVGENRFNDRDITTMIGAGAISSGSFSGFLTVIFGSGSGAAFSTVGPKLFEKRQLMEYKFHVPLEKSRYNFGGAGTHVVTAFGGTFLIDPETLELVRLVVRTARLPAETGACEATSTLDYERVRLNAGEFILPKEVLLEIIDTNGAENVNRTVFSDCHEFVGESTIRFEPPEDTTPGTKTSGSRPSAFIIPAGLPFKIALAEDIRTDRAAAGDPLKARLLTPIRDHYSKVLVPGGSAVSARIVEVRRLYGYIPTLLVRFKLESVNVRGVLYRLNATVQPAQRTILNRGARNPLVPREYLGVMKSDDPSVAAIGFANVGNNYTIRTGLEVSWLTASQENGPLTVPPPVRP
jgi:hypothetical protein